MNYKSPLKLLGTIIAIGSIATGCSYNASKYGASVEMWIR
jgi:hypothetical protein